MARRPEQPRLELHPTEAVLQVIEAAASKWRHLSRQDVITRLILTGWSGSLYPHEAASTPWRPPHFIGNDRRDWGLTVDRTCEASGADSLIGEVPEPLAIRTSPR